MLLTVGNPQKGAGQKGPGKPIFSAEVIEKHGKTTKIVEKSYNIYAKTTTQGGGAKRRLLFCNHFFIDLFGQWLMHIHTGKTMYIGRPSS